jgi:hypothetical protein
MQPCSGVTVGDISYDAFLFLQCHRNASRIDALLAIQAVRGFPLLPADRATINARASSITGARLEW